MTDSDCVSRLYPMAIAVADVGVGIALYETGIVVFAIVLWLAGLVTCLSVVSSDRNVLGQHRSGRRPQ